MTVSNTPLLATLYSSDSSRMAAVTIRQRTTSPLRLFKRNKLAALITSTILLHACSTLPENAPEETADVAQPERVAVTQSRTNTVRQSRSIASPVWELDGLRDDIESPTTEQTVWFRVSQGLGFALEHHNDDIQGQIDWFSNNPDYMLQVTDRSAPFIYEIVAEIERRQLPLELALLPVIESGYNPNARSSSDAAGLWQFMAATATTFGLKRDWWYDGRNDPIASTNAALDYIERLNAQFGGDWLLTLAAYNAGEGTVLRAIERNQRRNRPTDFWSLPLPGETQRHIPRLLGLAHVMADPDAYGITLSHIPNQPYLASVETGSQIDLTLVANLADLDPDMVFRLNPGYLQWATHPDGPHTVWLPADKLEVFESNFANMETSPITWDRYVIKSGDTLGAIARAHNTQVPILQQVNNLSDARIIAGQTLLIPRAYRDGDPLPLPNTLLAAANSQPVPSTAYQVRSGDSLWEIANRYKLSISELATWNNIDPSAVLRPGQSLRMQPQVTLAANDTPSASATNPAQEDSVIQYQVRRGDTLVKIARDHNVTVREIAEWNRIQANSIIRPGQELIVRRNP
jgi:membrane-bound lytic murein transglycosylase D